MITFLARYVLPMIALVFAIFIWHYCDLSTAFDFVSAFVAVSAFYLWRTQVRTQSEDHLTREILVAAYQYKQIIERAATPIDGYSDHELREVAQTIGREFVESERTRYDFSLRFREVGPKYQTLKSLRDRAAFVFANEYINAIDNLLNLHFRFHDNVRNYCDLEKQRYDEDIDANCRDEIVNRLLDCSKEVYFISRNDSNFKKDLEASFREIIARFSNKLIVEKNTFIYSELSK